MPPTALRMQVRDAFDPRENIFGGTRYLRVLANMFNGDLTLTIAGYNAGEAAVVRYAGIPPYEETQGYVTRCSRITAVTAPRTILSPPRRSEARRRGALCREAQRREVGRVLYVACAGLVPIPAGGSRPRSETTLSPAPRRLPMTVSLVDLQKRAPELAHTKPPIDPATLLYKTMPEAPDWRRIPAYADVTEEQFLDHRWQAKKSITRPDKLLEALRSLVSEEFIKDATAGFARSPMSVRVSPYLLSLINWDDPYKDPIRTQFIPLASRFLPDHPKLGLDSLHERADAPVPGLTHRYADKALFLPLDTCPVYCRFCTRSYAVGIDTEGVEKTHFKVDEERWQRA